MKHTLTSTDAGTRSFTVPTPEPSFTPTRLDVSNSPASDTPVAVDDWVKVLLAGTAVKAASLVVPDSRHSTCEVTVDPFAGAPAAVTWTLSVVVCPATGALSDGAPYPKLYVTGADCNPTGDTALTVRECWPAVPPSANVVDVGAVAVGWVTGFDVNADPSIEYITDVAAEFDVAAGVVNVTVHDSAAFTVEVHDPFGVGQETLGTGGLDRAMKNSVAAPYPDDNIESYP